MQLPSLEFYREDGQKFFKTMASNEPSDGGTSAGGL